MPLTESGRAFWSLDETEALLAAAPRWGFSAAKLRENVAQLSHFSTKQVSSKLADLQIQNRSGSRAAATKKRNSKPDRHSEAIHGYQDARGLGQASPSGSTTTDETSSDPNYEPSSPGYSETTSPQESALGANFKKRERPYAPELPSADPKRQQLLDARLQTRAAYPFMNPAGLAAFGPAALPSLPGHFPSSSGFPFPTGLMLPPLLGLSPAGTLFPNADKLPNPLDAGVQLRAVLLKEGFVLPPGTKPSLVEVPHPFIRCYSSPDVFKVVINPVLFGTTVDILIPQEQGGHNKALLKIDWKLSATPFDADFDFRRHPSLTELYQCPLPATLNKNFAYTLHQTADAICIMFPLERAAFSNFETAIAALSTLAAVTSSTDDASPASSSAPPPSPPASVAPTSVEEAPTPVPTQGPA
jgi:hypothetical protein